MQDIFPGHKGRGDTVEGPCAFKRPSSLQHDSNQDPFTVPGASMVYTYQVELNGESAGLCKKPYPFNTRGENNELRPWW